VVSTVSNDFIISNQNVTANQNLEDDNPETMWLDDDNQLGGFDWRHKVKLGMVKDQQQCGCCWAFAALATVEHHLRIYKNLKENFSEQQLIDCSRSYGNTGCQGGFSQKAYKYIMVSSPYF
jgi:C1A family cysteine protease